MNLRKNSANSASKDSASVSQDSTLSSDPDMKVTISKRELDSLLTRAVEKAVADALEASTTLFNSKIQMMDDRCNAQEKRISEIEERMKKMEIANNHLEQYSRRSHLRIRGLRLTGESNCKTEVASFINSRLKKASGSPFALSASDLDAAHPLPSRNREEADANGTAQPPTRPPTLIVRFHSRDVRDEILRSRRQLKASGISIAEDLTGKNARLLTTLTESKDFDAAWSWAGKVYAKPHGSNSVRRFDIFDV